MHTDIYTLYLIARNSENFFNCRFRRRSKDKLAVNTWGSRGSIITITIKTSQDFLVTQLDRNDCGDCGPFIFVLYLPRECFVQLHYHNIRVLNSSTSYQETIVYSFQLNGTHSSSFSPWLPMQAVKFFLLKEFAPSDVHFHLSLFFFLLRAVFIP